MKATAGSADILCDMKCEKYLKKRNQSQLHHLVNRLKSIVMQKRKSDYSVEEEKAESNQRNLRRETHRNHLQSQKRRLALSLCLCLREEAIPISALSEKIREEENAVASDCLRWSVGGRSVGCTRAARFCTRGRCGYHHAPLRCRLHR